MQPHSHEQTHLHLYQHTYSFKHSHIYIHIHTQWHLFFFVFIVIKTFHKAVFMLCIKLFNLFNNNNETDYVYSHQRNNETEPSEYSTYSQLRTHVLLGFILKKTSYQPKAQIKFIRHTKNFSQTFEI